MIICCKYFLITVKLSVYRIPVNSYDGKNSLMILKHGDKIEDYIKLQYKGTLRSNAVKNRKVIDMKMYSIIKESA